MGVGKGVRCGIGFVCVLKGEGGELVKEGVGWCLIDGSG